jgi:ribose/xylose/arabinose/galactoside ABC-type transport system permease subunit
MITGAAVTNAQPELARQFPNMFFTPGRTGVMAEDIAGVLVNLREAGSIGNRVALVNVADAFGIEMVGISRGVLDAAGFEIVYETSYPLGTQDVAPDSARLVGVDVRATQALAFALGGAVTAAGGALVSMFLTLDASVGVLFTMKALIIVIMGGVGDIRGTIVAALILGIAETAVARLIDPGLTLAAAYVLFLGVLLFRPQGLFGKKPT